MSNAKIKERDAAGRIPQIWNLESAISEAKKYENKKDFRLKQNSAYQYLVRHGAINLIPTSGKRHRLDTWEIFCSLKKCRSWGEFMYEYPKEYTAFHKRKGIIHYSAYSHLGIPKTSKKWNVDSIMIEAKKYTCRSDFSKKSSGAYDAAVNMKIVDDVCSHMERLQSDFDCVYMWEAKKESGRTLVKFGVTSQRLGSARIDFVEKKSGLKAIRCIFKNAKNALFIEKKLKEIGESAELSGFSGSSEFFWLNDEEIKTAIEVIENEAT
jgi:hypothetical protein